MKDKKHEPDENKSAIGTVK